MITPEVMRSSRVLSLKRLSMKLGRVMELFDTSV